ncbi:MAG: hypothetical protein LUI60_02285 [Clostridia bacterium]|nr:hypothetical protein [Clostridia bacterium]
MDKKRKHLNFDKEDLYEDLISANEYTGFLQQIPVSNEEIELYKRMYGGGPYGDDQP